MTTKLPASMADPDMATQAELDAAIATEVTNRNAAIAAAVPAVPLTLGTAQATTSGTSKDFTGLPAGIKRITVLFNGVSLSGTSGLLVQLGTSGGVVSTGYGANGIRTSGSSTSSNTSSTAGMSVSNSNAADLVSGQMVFTHLGGNVWAASHTFKGASNIGLHGGGEVALGAVLDRIRVTTVNGTDTFDGGSVNILYE